MDLQNLSGVVAAALGPLELAVCALALRRRLWRILPYFVAYLIVLITVDIGRWAVLLAAGASSRAYSWVYWMTQPVHILARAAALADICRATLGSYTGVWRLARPLLLAAATLLLAVAAIRTSGTGWLVSYLIFLERELEFAVVISLLLLLLFTRYYGLVLERPLDGIALGAGFYSSFVIIKDTIILVVGNQPWAWYSLSHSLAFAITAGIWIYALRAPLPERVQPNMSSIRAYEDDTRAVSERMRELNDRLLKLMKG